MTDDPTRVDPVAAHTAAWADREPARTSPPALVHRPWPIWAWVLVFAPFTIAAGWGLGLWTVESVRPLPAFHPPVAVAPTTAPPPVRTTVTRQQPAPPPVTVTVVPPATPAPPNTTAPSTTPASTPRNPPTPSEPSSIGDLLP